MVEVEVQAKLNDLAVIPSMQTVPLNGTSNSWPWPSISSASR